MAHPLNQAIIDPKLRIVAAGYGILQPRIGVSVRSAARSRLAAIYSGQSGFDIYTRAISDAYQDLYGEGIFTGKGIYEVATLHAVLDRRFPRNALLSHDLIEGAYARAGLATRHRAGRRLPLALQRLHPPQASLGARRLADRPMDVFARARRGGRQRSQSHLADLPLEDPRQSAPLPRRSGTFLLLVFGWLCCPEAARSYWTLSGRRFCYFCRPCFNLVVSVGKAIAEDKLSTIRDATRTFLTTLVTTLLTLIFLAHQTLLSLDAVVRAIVRAAFTRERLLEWETAAEAELSTRRGPADLYLNWIPAFPLLSARWCGGFSTVRSTSRCRS